VIITDKKKVEDGEIFGWLAERAWLGALAVASLVGVLLINSVSAAATHGHHVVAHSPKTLVAARASDRIAGHHMPAAVKAVKQVTRVHRPRHH
jgi:hypothetical protein